MAESHPEDSSYDNLHAVKRVISHYVECLRSTLWSFIAVSFRMLSIFLDNEHDSN